MDDLGVPQFQETPICAWIASILWPQIIPILTPKLFSPNYEMIFSHDRLTELTPKKIYSCIQEDASLQNLPKLQTTFSMGLVWCKWNIPYQQHVRESAFLSFSSLMRCSKNWNSLPSLARNRMQQASYATTGCMSCQSRSKNIRVCSSLMSPKPIHQLDSRYQCWQPQGSSGKRVCKAKPSQILCAD